MILALMAIAFYCIGRSSYNLILPIAIAIGVVITIFGIARSSFWPDTGNSDKTPHLPESETVGEAVMDTLQYILGSVHRASSHLR